MHFFLVLEFYYYVLISFFNNDIYNSTPLNAPIEDI